MAKTLFMDGDAVKGSWAFPLLESFNFSCRMCCCGVIGCRAVLKSQCLFCSAGLSHYIGEETDGQVRRGKPGVLSLSSTKWAADACDFLRDGDK